MQQITRFNDATTQTITFTSSASTTGGFNLAVYSGAMLLVTATPSSAATAITFVCKATEQDADSFVVADSTNTPVAMTVQPGRAYSLPDELFAAGYVMATTASGTVSCRVIVKA